MFTMSNVLANQVIGFTFHIDLVSKCSGQGSGSYLDFTHLFHI